MQIIKKVLVGAVAALLLVAGPAVADPYPATVKTTTSASGPQKVDRDERPTTKVRVRTGGNSNPKGKLEVTYERVKGGFRMAKTVKYPGSPVTFTGPKLHKLGKYAVHVRFVPKPDSVWKPSRDSYTFKVVK